VASELGALCIEATPSLRSTPQLLVSRLGDGKLASRFGSGGRSLHQDVVGYLCQTHGQIEDAKLADSLKRKIKKDFTSQSIKVGASVLDARRKYQ